MPRGGDQSARHRAVVRAVRDAAPSVGWWLVPVGQTSGRVTRPVVSKGFPDLVGVGERGRFIAVEVKTGSGKLDRYQRSYKDLLESKWAIHLVVSSVDDFLAQARRGR